MARRKWLRIAPSEAVLFRQYYAGNDCIVTIYQDGNIGVWEYTLGWTGHFLKFNLG